MSSSAAPTNTSALTFNKLPRSVFGRAIAPFLTTVDLLALSSVDRATRQLVLTPELWRSKVFTSFPIVASSVSSLPSWCDVVQLVDLQRARADDAPASLDSLVRFPNLRRLYNLSPHFVPRDRHSTGLTSPLASLAGLRRLTRITFNCGFLALEHLRLLSTLPVLASFGAQSIRFEAGNEETLTEWLAVSCKKKGTKRRLGKDEAKDESDEEREGKEEGQEDEGNDMEDGEEKETDVSGYDTPEDPNDPSLPQRYSPRLLFFHALAIKPTFVHLKLDRCDITPFVMGHMPVWPHLLCLSVRSLERMLRNYSFANAATRYPSLTSLALPCCSTAAIKHLVRLPRLEELRFPSYTRKGEDEDECGVQTTERGFQAFTRAASLRSVQYTPPDGWDDQVPTVASLTALVTLSNLTRLTVNAQWLPEDACVQLFTQHRFDRLRCLELVAQYGCGDYICPQTDAALLPLVKPADMVVAGREERQAARAVKRRERHANVGTDRDCVEEAGCCDIPADNAANFPALECLALPYLTYNRSACENTGRVSAWIKQQLRRSYEYEVAAEWEAELQTLGEAELLKSMA